MSNEENTVEQGPKVHTINNMDEFATFLSESGFFMMDQSLGTFYDAYLSIGKGCGCSKKKRVDAALGFYKGMVDTLSFGTKNAIRASLEVNQVDLKHNNELILSF